MVYEASDVTSEIHSLFNNLSILKLQRDTSFQVRNSLERCFKEKSANKTKNQKPRQLQIENGHFKVSHEVLKHEVFMSSKLLMF